MRVSAVLFDLDGLLIDTETISKRAWERAALEFGFEFTNSLYRKIAGRSMISAEEVLKSHLAGYISVDDYINRASYFYNKDIDTNGTPLMPGTSELLDYLDLSDLKVAIVTSTSIEQAQRKLKISRLDERIKTVVSSEEVENGKPAPDLFILAAERLSTAVGQCMVVEDAEHGIVGASTAGMIPVMVPGTLPPSDYVKQISYKIVPTLIEVINILQKVVGGR